MTDQIKIDKRLIEKSPGSFIFEFDNEISQEKCDEIIKRETYKILEKFEKYPGYIFNLGHGITPDINPNKIKYLTNIVREY